MKTNKLFMIASGGILAGIVSIFLYNDNVKPQEPLSVSFNPYESGIYASGIVESYQQNGSNISIYPEVAGDVIDLKVTNGSLVKKDELMFVLDHDQEQAQVELDEANVQLAKDNLLTVQQQYEKLKKAFDINPKSVSKLDLDNSKNTVVAAMQNIAVAEAQLKIDKAYLDNFFVTSPVDGIILRVVPAVGDFVSPVVGAYDIYTQGNLPAIQIGHHSSDYQVRVYVDEILIPLLPQSQHLEATLFVRGLNNKGYPLQYVNLQPYTIPNIELSDQRNERVDVRVLPIIFKFEKPKNINIFPGQLVDVYIKGKA